ncbi:DUF3054 domain-containing protein [Leucobacter luti]|uniref:DUF3054 family protein n=1 Tax=Leucobacter luti TaxID=340320 RepID=A0A4Q7TXB6_9MICO|nr:DUF3054 domain-containing protein [Leucobacter luti]MBL3698510.1 DUF3054 domain-containing protein [Leucobacter luti]RZT65884.1 DUF3054 family protein [Leucobacter luti]
MSGVARPAAAPHPVRTALLALACDAALVVLFAALGRSSHAREATLLGLLETAWPFLAGLAITWISARISKRPLALWSSGLPVWVGTVAIGLLLRWWTGGGVAFAFVLVTILTLGLFLLGWRAIAALVARLRRPRAA